MNTQIKVCCMASFKEAEYAIRAGANAVGFVCATPESCRTIDINLVSSITSNLPSTTDTVLLTSENTAEKIAQKVHLAGTSSVQIISHLALSESEKLPELLPNTRLIQVIHVESKQALELIEQYAPYVNTFLLDSGRPSLSKPEYGGTGRTHDWSISAEFVRRSPIPVFLAGGLSPSNVEAAIKEVRPYGVDLCSGVRTRNRLDHKKLDEFIGVIRQADAKLDISNKNSLTN
jgi:phosphoribosylanthranilate isomerase